MTAFCFWDSAGCPAAVGCAASPAIGIGVCDATAMPAPIPMATSAQPTPIPIFALRGSGPRSPPFPMPAIRRTAFLSEIPT